MNIQGDKIYEQLCTYDERNPYFAKDNDSEAGPGADGCYCDNCFYGRHVMAQEIIILREMVKAEAVSRFK